MRRDRGAALCAVLASGCAAHSSRHAARTLDPGDWRTVVALDAVMFVRGNDWTVRPAPELALRRGMGDGGWDLGGKLGAGSLEVSARFRAVDRLRLAFALVGGLRTDFAIGTNNTSDLFRTTAFGHAVIERCLSARTSLVLTASPALTLADSGTLFAGTTADTRILIEPALGVGVRINVRGRVLWPEATITLPYAFGDGFEHPIVQAGIGVEL